MPGTRRAAIALDSTVTHRLHTLQKLSDRLTQQAYAGDAGIALGEGRCLAAIGAFSPLSVNDLAMMRPALGSRSPASVASKVDLPAPLRPRMASRCPAAMDRSSARVTQRPPMSTEIPQAASRA